MHLTWCLSLYLWAYSAQFLPVFIIDFNQVSNGWEGYEKWKIYAIFILIHLVPLFRPSEFKIVFFFYISIYRGYYALPCHDFKANIQEEKTIFKISVFFPETISKYKNLYMLYLQC